MITNIYEIKKLNHAEEIIHYLKNLVVPKAITRNKHGRDPHSISTELSAGINERIFPMDSFTQILNGNIDEVTPVQLFI